MICRPERVSNLFITWGADFEWLIKDVVYGIFYADTPVLISMEKELITSMGIVCLRLPVQISLGRLAKDGLVC